MRRLSFALALVLTLFAPQQAVAWTDARPAGLITELVVDRDGGATVTLRVRWRVLAGRFRAFEMAELPSDFTLLEASGTDASGAPVPVATRSPGSGRLELTLGEEGGVRRGNIDVVVRYTTSLRAQGAVRRSGSEVLLEVATIPWERGLEATELRVAIPASVRRAQWIADDTPGVDATVTSELGRDVVHALRRHLPAGTRWNARIACDPALFPWLDTPVFAPQVATRNNHRSLAPAAIAIALSAFAAALFARFADRKRPRPARFTPPRGGGVIAPAFCAIGVALHTAALFGASNTLTAGLVFLLMGMLFLLPERDALEAPASGASSLWPQGRVQALRKTTEKEPTRWYFVVVALLGLALLVQGLIKHQAGFCAFGAELMLVSLLLPYVLFPSKRPTELSLLEPFSKRIEKALQKNTAVRLAWRVRGNGKAPGALKIRVIPRPGFRLGGGLRALELSIGWNEGLLGWRATPRWSVRARVGSTAERWLRSEATKAGRIEHNPERGELAWVADAVGPDRDLSTEAALAVLQRCLIAAPNHKQNANAATEAQQESALTLK